MHCWQWFGYLIACWRDVAGGYSMAASLMNFSGGVHGCYPWARYVLSMAPPYPYSYFGPSWSCAPNPKWWLPW